MKVNSSTLELLNVVIRGDSEGYNYRSGPQLVDFFNSFGSSDLYGTGFPSRHVYVREKLNEFNGTKILKDIVVAAVHVSEDEAVCEDLAFQLSKKISASGFKLRKSYGSGFMHNHEYIEGAIQFEVVPTSSDLQLNTTLLFTESSMTENLSKARNRLEQGDSSGAIAICYTIVEEFLKLRLQELPDDYNENEGDIKKLYKLLAKQTGMEISQDTPEALKPLLSSLTGLVSGFYEVANKASDRHQKKFTPSIRHARLVVSLTFSFCEYLLESKKDRAGDA